MLLKIFSPKKLAKKVAFLPQTKAKLCKILIITLLFEKKRQLFRRKLSKIAENCDHNIDPLFAVLRPFESNSVAVEAFEMSNICT
jgi:hypothetical protein